MSPACRAQTNLLPSTQATLHPAAAVTPCSGPVCPPAGEQPLARPATAATQVLKPPARLQSFPNHRLRLAQTALRHQAASQCRAHCALQGPGPGPCLAMNSALPPRMMSVPRPAMLVAMVTAPLRPLLLTISLSFSTFSGLAFSSRNGMSAGGGAGQPGQQALARDASGRSARAPLRWPLPGMPEGHKAGSEQATRTAGRGWQVQHAQLGPLLQGCPSARRTLVTEPGCKRL